MPCCLRAVEKQQNSLNYSLDYSAKLFIYGLLLVSLWACFSPAIAPSHLPIAWRMATSSFSVCGCYTGKRSLKVAQKDLSLPSVPSWQRCWWQGRATPCLVHGVFLFGFPGIFSATKDCPVFGSSQLLNLWEVLREIPTACQSYGRAGEGRGEYSLSSAWQRNVCSHVTHSGNPLHISPQVRSSERTWVSERSTEGKEDSLFHGLPWILAGW